MADYCLGSLAKGTESHVRALIDNGVVQTMLAIVTNSKSDKRMIETCLCALRSIFRYPFAPITDIHSDMSSLQHIISKFFVCVCSCVLLIMIFFFRSCLYR